MLPGKVYKPEDVLQVLKSRIWVLLLPFAVIAAATAVWVHRLPDQYRSETVILVVPQRVPESYVRSTVTTRIEDRLQSLVQQILSRTRLERIVRDFDLYAKERKTGIMEDVIEQMRRDIGVEVLRGDSFRISFIGDNPRMVMRVTERLASLFIEENLRDREVLADDTNQFLRRSSRTLAVGCSIRKRRLKRTGRPTPDSCPLSSGRTFRCCRAATRS
jgi:uncharacterized protein involved in exopolysaccharide biosynthesis